MQRTMLRLSSMFIVHSIPFFHPYIQFQKTFPFILPEPIKVSGNENQNSLWGPLTLYFGCRSSKHDDIYKSETTKALEDGGLDKVYTAFSREPSTPKVISERERGRGRGTLHLLKQYLTNTLQTYVQDLIKKNKKEIYDMLVNKNGHFYVCGDVSMAEDVHTSLEVGSVKHIEYNRSSLFWCKHNTKHFQN